VAQGRHREDPVVGKVVEKGVDHVEDHQPDIDNKGLPQADRQVEGNHRQRYQQQPQFEADGVGNALTVVLLQAAAPTEHQLVEQDVVQVVPAGRRHRDGDTENAHVHDIKVEHPAGQRGTQDQTDDFKADGMTDAIRACSHKYSN